MRSRLPSFALPLALALVAGCASGPAFMAPEQPAPGTATVYVFRASHLLGAGVKHAAALDGRPIGTLVNGSYLQASVAMASDAFADLRLAGCERLAKPLLLRAGQTYYVQASLTNKTVYLGGKAYFDYGCVLAERSPAEATPMLQGLPRAAAVAVVAAPSAPATPAPGAALPPTSFDALREQALVQDRTAEAGDYLQRLKQQIDWRDASGVRRMVVLPHDKAILECVGAVIPTPSPVQLAFRVAQDGTVVDAHTDQQEGFITECLARKVVGLRLPPPPQHGFALCHRVERDGERSVVTPCSGIGWTERCEQSGTTQRCRLEFRRAEPDAKKANAA